MVDGQTRYRNSGFQCMRNPYCNGSLVMCDVAIVLITLQHAMVEASEYDDEYDD